MPIHFTHSGTQTTRTRLPFILANAVSIDKEKGQTLYHAYVHLGDQEFSPGLAYVALSHDKTFSSLSIHAVSEEHHLKLGSPSTRAQLCQVPCRLQTCDLASRRRLQDDHAHVSSQDRALAIMPVPGATARDRCRHGRRADGTRVQFRIHTHKQGVISAPGLNLAGRRLGATF